jgi:hypothetical protein
MNIQHLRNAFFHRWLAADDIRFFKPHAMLFDLGGTAKSRTPPASAWITRVRRFPSSLVSHDLYTLYFTTAEIVEARASGPQNERAHARSHLSFFGALPHLSPDRRGAGSSKRMESPLG